MCSSHCFNRLSRKAAIDAFNQSYLHPRYLKIIYNCLIIYFTFHIHAMTYDNSITAFTTPFHQSAPNSWPHWWCDWLPNQHRASIRIYFQGVYCDINTLVLYHLSLRIVFGFTILLFSRRFYPNYSTERAEERAEEGLRREAYCFFKLNIE